MDDPAAHTHMNVIRGREAVMAKAKVEGAVHGPFFYSMKVIKKRIVIGNEPNAYMMTFWANGYPLNKFNFLICVMGIIILEFRSATLGTSGFGFLVNGFCVNKDCFLGSLIPMLLCIRIN